MATVNQKLGEKIRKIRIAKKLTQEDLAFQAGVDYSYLNEIEAGKRNPSVKRVAELSKVLDTPLKELFDF